MTLNRELTRDQAIRYSRQILLKDFDLAAQETLLNSRILLVGLGGLGCSAAQFLVAAGAGELILVDDDHVALSNLQRQVLHHESDLSENKACSALQSLTLINSECRLQAIEQRLSDESLAQISEKCDIIVDCSDNLETRMQLNRASLSCGKPLVSGAAIRMEGQVTVFVPGPLNPCYACFCRFFGEQQLSCVEAGVMSPVVGITGAMQALETIKQLTGYGNTLAGQVAMFDFMRNDWQHINIQKQNDCICQVT